MKQRVCISFQEENMQQTVFLTVKEFIDFMGKAADFMVKNGMVKGGEK